MPVPRADDEIAALANEMNTMLDRVQREDERRRQFVSDASHELRSPIATIRAQAEAALVDTDQRELAEGVLAEAERMSALVDDLLALARHDEQLPARVRSSISTTSCTARRPGHGACRSTSEMSPPVRFAVAPDELTRVVVHLLDNAARHAASKAEVSLTADEHAVILTVDDDGVGIPVEERERGVRAVRPARRRPRPATPAAPDSAWLSSPRSFAASGGTIVAEESPLGGARLRAMFPPADC